MSRLYYWPLLLAILVLTAAKSLPVSAEGIEFPGLKALMSDKEFRSAGLNTLTPTQRAALNRWLANHARFELIKENKKKAEQSPAAETPPGVTAKRLTRAQRHAVPAIQTRIAGAFKGWSGKTLFAMENGQYWKQRLPGRYFHRAESPEVEVYKTRLGFWEMKILATGKTVGVSRYEPRN